MHILELELRDFRNYEKARLQPCAGLNLLYGDNGQGKTNLLEAVFLCCLGRSHRTPREKELIRYGQENASVQLTCEKKRVRRRIRYNLLLNERRRILIDGAPALGRGELMGALNCVLFAPEHLSIVKEGPLERRRFLDMELSQAFPSYFYTLQQYNRALRQRNNLLRTLAKDNSAQDTLPVWDEQLAQLGAFLMARRRSFTENLCTLARDNHKDISGGRELLDLRYAPNLSVGDAEGIQRALLAHRREDLRLQTTTAGPHRDDLTLLLDGREIRAYGSQGQQRTAALSLKLSELSLLKEETGEWPILMLDDVLSELDENRQRYLMERVLPVQTFLTTTKRKKDWPAGKAFLVRQGSVQADGD